MVEAAWDLPRSGLPGYGAGLLGAAVFVGDVVALVFPRRTGKLAAEHRRGRDGCARRAG
jgi:hypothetical protein